MSEAARPTIAVLGTLTHDTTIYADKSQSDNLGGLLYTLSALAFLFDGRARVRVVANVGRDLEPRIRSALAALPGVETEFLRIVDRPNNHVHLTYLDADRRDEVLVGLVPPIDLEHALAAVDGADHVLVNLTSGFDLELGTMRGLRRHFAGTIQFDIHSLTLAMAADGRRSLQKPADWRLWMACADWVQMNETEARLLGDGRAPETWATQVLDLGPRSVCVTLGRDGAFGCWRGDGGTRSLRLPAAARPVPPYPTGCGDVFGAAFAWARAQGAGEAAALRCANGVAGTKAGFEPDSALRAIRTHAAAHLAAVTTAA